MLVSGHKTIGLHDFFHLLSVGNIPYIFWNSLTEPRPPPTHTYTNTTQKQIRQQCKYCILISQPFSFQCRLFFYLLCMHALSSRYFWLIYIWFFFLVLFLVSFLSICQCNALKVIENVANFGQSLPEIMSVATICCWMQLCSLYRWLCYPVHTSQLQKHCGRAWHWNVRMENATIINQPLTMAVSVQVNWFSIDFVCSLIYGGVLFSRWQKVFYVVFACLNGWRRVFFYI